MPPLEVLRLAFDPVLEFPSAAEGRLAITYCWREAGIAARWAENLRCMQRFLHLGELQEQRHCSQPRQPKPVSCHAAVGITGLAGPAYVRSLAIDGAPGSEPDLSHQCVTSVPMAPHATQTVVDKLARNAAQIGLVLHREPRPLPRVRAAGPARVARSDRLMGVESRLPG